MKKWVWRVLGVLGLFILGGATLIYGLSERRLNREYTDVRAAEIVVPTDAAAITEGKRLYTARGCADCHGENLAGKLVVADPMAGKLSGGNLTRGRGGLPASYSDADFVRAIRNGIRRDNRAVLWMPSYEYALLAGSEIGHIIAYIRSVPPIDHTPEPAAYGPALRLLALLGEVPIAPEIIRHDAPLPIAPEAKASLEFGRYLANTCTGCHGEGFSGGPIPGTPPDFKPASNITPDKASGIGKYTEADFFAAMQQGKRPDGSPIDPLMPWKNFGQLTETEVRALWVFLRTVPAKAAGNR